MFFFLFPYEGFLEINQSINQTTIMKYFYFIILIFLINTHLSAENYYWIGGTGEWEDPTHWSLSEFGTGESANAIPTIEDNVYFNEFSFTNDGQTLYVSENNIYCREMDWIDLTHEVVFHFRDNPNEAKRVNISGSLLLSPEMSVSGDDALWLFNSATANNLIYTAENQLPHVEFNNENGSWQLFDDLDVRGVIRHWGGELTTNDKSVSCRNFMSTGSILRRLILGNSTIQASQELRLENNNLDLHIGTSTLFCSVLNASGLTLNDVVLLIGEAIPRIEGGNLSFNNLSFGGLDALELLATELLGAPLEFVLPAGTDINISGSFLVSSLCQTPVSLISSQPGVQAFIYNQTDFIGVNDVRIRDVNANGDSLIALNCYDDGNNSGWQFIGEPGACNLPVELSAFFADCENRNTRLQWTTLTESNSEYFAVEVSRNGTDFEEITKIPAAGNTTLTQNYTFVDTNLRIGEHYYRLKQVDTEGSYEYSDIVATTCVTTTPEIIEIYPNPVRETATVHFNLATDVSIRTSVFSQQGQLLIERNNTMGEGFHNINFDTKQLPKGVYVLQVCVNEQCEVQKFLKE